MDGEGDGLSSLTTIYKNTFQGGLRLTWEWKTDENVLSATPETEHRQMGLEISSLRRLGEAGRGGGEGERE